MRTDRIQIAVGRLTWLLGLFAVLGGRPAVTVAASALSLEVNNVDWQGGGGPNYSGFDPITYSYSANLSVKSDGSGGGFFVTFSSNAGGDVARKLANGPNELQYQIYDTPSHRTVLKDLPAATASEVLTGVFAPGETKKTFSFVVTIPAQQIKPPGLYQDAVKITLYQGTLSGYAEASSRTIAISTRVAELAELALVNPGEPFAPQAVTKALDFGTLVEGKSLSFDLRVRSNAGYQVTLESESGGRLKHSNPADPSQVPYTVSLGGTRVDISRGRAVPLARQRILTSAQGDSYACVVTIGPVSDLSPGNYRDNILVSVATDH